MKKKILAALLCASMVFSMSACGDEGGDSEKSVHTDPPTVTSLATLDDLDAILVDDYAITDEQMEEAFSSLLFTAGGGLYEVTDRDVVQEGDIVLAGFAGTPNEALAATLSADELKELQDNMSTSSGAEQLIDVAKNGALDESTGLLAGYYISGDWGKFTDGLIGAKVGEEKSHEVIFPDKYSQEERLQSQKATFVFTVEKIYTRMTFDNMSEEDIAKYLEEDYDIKNKAEAVAYVKEVLAYSTILDYIVAESVVNIPENYLDWRADQYLTYMDETYTSLYGISFETFLSTYYGQTIEQAKLDVLEWLKDSVIPAEVIYSEYVVSKELAVDEDALSEMVNEALTNYSSYYSNADDVYKEYGCGIAEIGKAYILNQTAFDKYFEELYDSSSLATE